jgi:hypothetical protein
VKTSRAKYTHQERSEICSKRALREWEARRNTAGAPPPDPDWQRRRRIANTKYREKKRKEALAAKAKTAARESAPQKQERRKAA